MFCLRIHLWLHVNILEVLFQVDFEFFFAHSTWTQINNFWCLSQSFTFLKPIFFIQQSVCKQKHETNFVYIKNSELSISLIIRLPKVCLTIRNTSMKHSKYQKWKNKIQNCLKCDHATSIYAYTIYVIDTCTHVIFWFRVDTILPELSLWCCHFWERCDWNYFNSSNKQSCWDR